MTDVFLISEKSRDTVQYNRYSILSNFYHFFFSIALSSTLLNSPTLGAAVYVFGEICSLVYDVFHQSHASILPDDLKGKGKKIILFATLFSVVGIIISFNRSVLSQSFFICVLLCLIPIRTILGNRLFVRKIEAKSISVQKMEFIQLLLLYLFILACAAMIIMLYHGMDLNKRWGLFFGFFLGSVLSVPSHWKSRRALRRMCLSNTNKQDVEAVWVINAYQLFRQTFVYVVIAVQVSLTSLLFFLNHLSVLNPSKQLLQLTVGLIGRGT